MNIEIKSKDGSVLWSGEAEDRNDAIKKAIASFADLSFADLSFADLSFADLSFADLSFADLSFADLSFADLSFADLSFAKGLPDAPIVENIDSSILRAVESTGKLDMGNWHTCATTHCRAGWAITLGGAAGAKLESDFGPDVAGTLIYLASRPTKPVPDFYCSNEDALDDLRKCAAEEAK